MLRLTVVQAPEGQTQIGESITIGHEGASIGRGAENTWRLIDEQRLLSRVHLTVVHEGGRFTLADLSANGAYLNGVLLGRGNCEVINHGDRIRLGDYDLLADLPDVTVNETYTATEMATNVAVPEPGDATFVADPEKWLLGQLGLDGCEAPNGEPEPEPEQMPEAEQGQVPAHEHEQVLESPLQAEPKSEPTPEPAPEPVLTLDRALAELAGVDPTVFSEAQKLDLVRAIAELVNRTYPQLETTLDADDSGGVGITPDRVLEALRELGPR